MIKLAALALILSATLLGCGKEPAPVTVDTQIEVVVVYHPDKNECEVVDEAQQQQRKYKCHAQID